MPNTGVFLRSPRPWPSGLALAPTADVGLVGLDLAGQRVVVVQ
jgi:hypothetical protein